MNNRISVLTLSVSLVLMVASCSRQAPNSPPDAQSNATTNQKITSASVVKVTPEPVSIKAGGSADTKVRLSIKEGYHVNANPPTYAYLKATEIEIPAGDGLSVASIVYPDPITQRFSFAEEPLAVYEGEAIIKVSLKADPSAQKGARQLSAKMRIQACDDEVCYPPGTIDVSIPLQVN